MGYSCFFVDMDDTLYPELSYVDSGYQTVSRYLSERYNLRYELVVLRLRYELLKFGRVGAFDRLLTHFDLTKAIVGELVAIYRNHAPAIELYSGVLKGLARLREVGPVVVITDGTATMQAAKVAALELEKYCDGVILTDKLGTSKPDRQVLEHASALIGMPYGKGVVIGDDPFHDLGLAREAAIDAIRVRTGRYAQLTLPIAEFPEVASFADACSLALERQ
jgi:putative hydrolase of the HAD superfamily